MIVKRKYFSDIDEEQREFANKYNKELKRKWQMEQGRLTGEHNVSGKRIKPAMDSKVLPIEGNGFEKLSSSNKRIAMDQYKLLDKGRSVRDPNHGYWTRENMQRRRGEKKVRGAKQTSELTLAQKKQELMKKANDRGVTRAQIADRVAKRKEAEAQKLAQKTTQQAAQQTTQKATQSAAKKGLEKVTNNKQIKEGMAKRAIGWVKKNPKLAGGSALGAALGTGAVLGYRQYKKNKED